MKKLILLFALLSVMGLAADFSGTWVGKADVTVDGEQQAYAAKAVLKQEGNTVTGTAGREEEGQTDIQNVVVEGDTIAFDMKPGEDAPVVHIVLKLDGDSLNGTVKSVGEGPEVTGKLELKREK
jgi:hypothetical protein